MLVSSLKKKLWEGRTYLRTDFRVNLKAHSPVLSHDMTYALSDPTSIYFQQTCPDAYTHQILDEHLAALNETLKEIFTLGQSMTETCEENTKCSDEDLEEKEVHNRLIKDAIFDIEEMRKHIIKFKEEAQGKLELF